MSDRPRTQAELNVRPWRYERASQYLEYAQEHLSSNGDTALAKSVKRLRRKVEDRRSAAECERIKSLQAGA